MCVLCVCCVCAVYVCVLCTVCVLISVSNAIPDPDTLDVAHTHIGAVCDEEPTNHYASARRGWIWAQQERFEEAEVRIFVCVLCVCVLCAIVCVRVLCVLVMRCAPTTGPVEICVSSPPRFPLRSLAGPALSSARRPMGDEQGLCLSLLVAGCQTQPE